MGCVFSKDNASDETKTTSFVKIDTPASSRTVLSIYDTTSFESEAFRLASLQSCNILNTPNEERFDIITSLAAAISDTPCSLVSLIDRNVLWFKSQIGNFGSCIDREGSFCSYILVPDHAQVLMVEDATKDARFSSNPFVVGPPHLRFYAGCPLVSSEGYRYGTLCVVDFRPRYLSSSVYNVLCNLAELVTRELERDRALLKIQSDQSLKMSSHLQSLMMAPTATPSQPRDDSAMVTPQLTAAAAEASCIEYSIERSSQRPASEEPVVIMDVVQAAWPILYANTAWCRLVTRNTRDDVDPMNDLIGCSIWDFVDIILDIKSSVTCAPHQECSREAYLNDWKVKMKRGPFTVRMKVRDDEHSVDDSIGSIESSGDGGGFLIDMELRLASRDQMTNAVAIGIPNFVGDDIQCNMHGIPDRVSEHYYDSPEQQHQHHGVREEGHFSCDTGDGNALHASALQGTLWLGIVISRPSMVRPYTPPNAAVQTSLLESRGFAEQQLATYMPRCMYPPPSGRGSLDIVNKLSNSKRLVDLQLGALLGQGSYGKVYRGVLSKDKEVAVKIIDTAELLGAVSSATASPDLENALKEGALSRHLAHPNIVPTLDYMVHTATTTVMPQSPFQLHGQSNDRSSSRKSTHSPDTPCNTAPTTTATSATSASHQQSTQIWIVQHLCNKGSLYDAIEKGWLRQSISLSSPPSLSSVVNTALEIASAMAYLHSQGILHGDLNGNNVLLSRHDANDRGFVALVNDFGLARLIETANIHTKTIGTVTHMSPELLRHGMMSKASDVYAFGVLLWEMWNSKRAWAGMHMGQIIYSMTIKKNGLALPEDAPKELRRVMEACLEEDPSLRLSFNEIVSSLRGLLSSYCESGRRV